MYVDAMKEEFEHIELFGNPALFTNNRVAPDTVQKTGLSTICVVEAMILVDLSPLK